VKEYGASDIPGQAGVGSLLIQRLLEHCHRHRFPARATIIRQGAPTRDLYYLVSGSVAVLLEDASGHEIVLAYLYAGDFFGEAGLFNEDSRRTALVRARGRCEIATISYARLRAMPDIFPGLLMIISRQMARRLLNTNRKVGNLAFMDVSGRLARMLIDLCDSPEASISPQGVRVRVTRHELGRLIGCSREMVGRVLKTMEAGRLIDLDGKDIVVKTVRRSRLARPGARQDYRLFGLEAETD